MPLWRRGPKLTKEQKRRFRETSLYSDRLWGTSWLLYLVAPEAPGQDQSAASMECGTLHFGEDGSFVWTTETIAPDGGSGASIELTRGRFSVQHSPETGGIALVFLRVTQPGMPIPRPGNPEYAEAATEIAALEGQPSVWVPLPQRLHILPDQSDGRRFVTIEIGGGRQFVLHKK